MQALRRRKQRPKASLAQFAGLSRITAKSEVLGGLQCHALRRATDLIDHESNSVFWPANKHHRVPEALALVALWATAAELSVCPDPPERMMIVWTFFRSDAGTDGAIAASGATAGEGVEAAGRRVLGSEEASAVFGGS
jgi:hypothetical protein